MRMIKWTIVSCVVFWTVLVRSSDYFVSVKNGNDANPGTQDKPFKTISQGVLPLKAGDRLIIREGVYRESVVIKKKKGTSDKPITIMSFKNEKVVIKGSDEYKLTDFTIADLPGFDKNNAWMKKRNRAVPKIFVMKEFPVNPSQVFVDGIALMQIGDDAKSVALDGNWTRSSTGSSTLDLRNSSFFYDVKTKTLNIRLPRHTMVKKDAVVEVSTRQSILRIGRESEFIILKGLNFSHTSTLGNPYGGTAVYLWSNCVMEDCTVTWCAGMGVAANGVNPKVLRCELAFNGNDGFNANKTENFLVSRCDIHHNNYRDYNRNWHTGGMKMIPDAYGVIEYNKIHDNYGYGIWFDSDNSGKLSIIRGNTVACNVGGIYLEASSDFLVENNSIVYNTVFAMQAIGSNIVIKNNTFAHNSGYCSIAVLPRGIKKYRPKIWRCENVSIENNLFMDNRTRIEIHLPKDDPKNGVGDIKCDYNSFIRVGGSKFRFTVGAVARPDYRDIMDNAPFSKWTKESGFDKNSYFWDGNIPSRFGKPKK